MKKHITSQFKKGFTILEMLMVLAIFGIITAVVMFNYGEFNSKTIMSNMAYEVALSVRQAQVYSLSVRGEANNNNFDNNYGVYFNTSNPKDFAFFIDRAQSTSVDPNGICDTGGIECLACESQGGGTECLEKITLTRDVTIERLCTSSDLNPVDEETGVCAGQDGDDVSDLTVTFKRPNPEAIVTVGGSQISGASAGIVLTTSYGNRRAIIIKPTGQISVQVIEDNSN
jgi:prepilin-type N-terminal cleavage/methylation domain-containing protein